jgi:hypothetical protein
MNLVAIGALCTVALGSVTAQASRRNTAYDGPWHLSFTTRAGSCDPTYGFDVNISNGVITHPNLVKFRGNVASSGAVRASVTVHDKFASGSGRLSLASGQGTWRGYSGSARCSGYWAAQKGKPIQRSFGRFLRYLAGVLQAASASDL